MKDQAAIKDSAQKTETWVIYEIAIKLVVYKPQNCLKALFLPFRNEVFKVLFPSLYSTDLFGHFE